MKIVKLEDIKWAGTRGVVPAKSTPEERKRYAEGMHDIVVEMEKVRSESIAKRRQSEIKAAQLIIG